MDAAEIHAKATIAAALITAHLVDVSAMPRPAQGGRSDQATLRLRELTDYVYQVIAGRT